MRKLPDYGKISFDDFEGTKFEDIVPEAGADAIDGRQAAEAHGDLVRVEQRRGVLR